MIDFSIIVPVYNAEKYLKYCLESILNQAYRNFEVILVDDGSTDDSGAICDEYALRDARFKVFHQQNAGVCIARKRGIQQASGAYICWVDADDYIGRQLLQELEKIIDAHSPDAIAFGYTDVTQDGKVLKVNYNNIKGDTLYFTNDSQFYNQLIWDSKTKDSYCGAVFYSLWSKAIKREKLTNCLLSVPDSLCVGEDMAAVFGALNICSTVYVSNICCYYYRQNDVSIVHTFREDELCRYRILFEYLSKNRGCIPQFNIDVYSLYTIMSYLSKAACNFENCEAYLKYVHAVLTADLRLIISRASIPNVSFTQHIRYYLVKHGFFSGLWIFQHAKGYLKKKLF